MSTKKQEKALEILVESGGTKSVGKAMVEAGYSPATAKTPQKLTESNAYKELFPLDKTKEVVENLHKLATTAVDEKIQVDATKVYLERAVPKSESNSTIIFNKGDIVKSKYVKD
jgi:hypothetical protein